MPLFNMRIFLAVSFLIICSAISPAASAEETTSTTDATTQDTRPAKDARNESPVGLNRAYFSGYVTDFTNIVTAPVRWDASDWTKASVVLGVSGVLFTQDDKIQTWVQNHKNSTTSHYADVVSSIYTYSLPALGGFGLYGYIVKDEKAERAFLLSAESAVLTAVFVQTLKRSTGRHRPSTGDSHDTWSGPIPSGHNEDLSFPSGDASTAFSIASVLASEYDNRVVPPLLYTAATLIALERVHNNAHWSSDVFVGSAIGYFTGKAVVASHRGGGESRLSFLPISDGRSVGLVMTYKF